MPQVRKIIKKTCYALTADQEDLSEMLLEHEPVSTRGDDLQIVKLSDCVVVGYLSYDRDCENPLEDCEGMGEIIDCRNRYGSKEDVRRAREALGMGEYGETTDENGDPYPQNPCVVLLDVYSHGGDVWRVHGYSHGGDVWRVHGGARFPDEQWDVSCNAGVWLPDDECRQHIECTAAEEFLWPSPWYAERRAWSYGDKYPKPPYPERPSDLPRIAVKYDVARKRYDYCVTNEQGQEASFDTVLAAAQAAAGYQRREFDLDAFHKLVREGALVCARDAVEVYNSWIGGDCYGVCIEKFSLEDGELLEEQACWSYIGYDYARSQLQYEMDAYRKKETA